VAAAYLAGGQPRRAVRLTVQVVGRRRRGLSSRWVSGATRCRIRDRCRLHRIAQRAGQLWASGGTPAARRRWRRRLLTGCCLETTGGFRRVIVGHEMGPGTKVLVEQRKERLALVLRQRKHRRRQPVLRLPRDNCGGRKWALFLHTRGVLRSVPCPGQRLQRTARATQHAQHARQHRQHYDRATLVQRRQRNRHHVH